jgi:hypothetical protein
MGRCDKATVSIGIKILLSDLISQINENNFNLIKKMLEVGCVEDENDDCNDTYINVIQENMFQKNYNYVEFREYITDEFSGYLFNMDLLVPIKNILSSERWGYNVSGTNSISKTMDSELSIDLEEYSEIKNLKTVIILKHEAY